MGILWCGLEGALAALVSWLPGDYHTGETLLCSDCHVVHRQKLVVGETAQWSATPEDRAEGPDTVAASTLLRDNVNDLCLECHDDSSRAADVLATNLGNRPTDVRQAGFLNRVGGPGFPATGHTLDSTAAAPGSEPTWSAEQENGSGQGLSCVNCHAPHGTATSGPTYRNLRSDAGNHRPGDGLVTYNHERPGILDPERDVFVRRVRDYDESAVDFLEPDPSDSAMARFCGGCHGGFHRSTASGRGTAEGGLPGAFLIHPAAGVDIGALGGRHSSLATYVARSSRVKVMSRSGRWAFPGDDATPSCFSCHKAHGNDNEFGLLLRSGTGTLSESGDSSGGSLESLCGQCHVQGDTSARPRAGTASSRGSSPGKPGG